MFCVSLGTSTIQGNILLTSKCDTEKANELNSQILLHQGLKQFTGELFLEFTLRI